MEGGWEEIIKKLNATRTNFFWEKTLNEQNICVWKISIWLCADLVVKNG